MPPGVYRNHHNTYHKGCARNSISLLCAPAPRSRLPDLSERVYVNEPLSSRGTSSSARRGGGLDGRGGGAGGGRESGSRTFSWISPAGGFWFLGESDGDGSDQQTRQEQEQEELQLQEQLQEHQSRLQPLSTGGSWRTSSAGSFASARSFASSEGDGLSEMPRGGSELLSGGEAPGTEQRQQQSSSPAGVVAMAVAAALEEKSTTSDHHHHDESTSEFLMPQEREGEEEEEDEEREESRGLIPSEAEREEVRATAAAAAATAASPEAHPPLEQQADGVDNKSGNGSPVVARHAGSSTDGSWHGQVGRGSSPLAGLSYANSPRSLLSLSDGGGGSSGGDGVVRGTARVGIAAAADSSHSSGELTYSRTPPLAAVRAAVAAAAAPSPTHDPTEVAVAAAAARLRDSSFEGGGSGGGWTLNSNDIRVPDEEGPAWLVALEEGVRAAAALPEGGAERVAGAGARARAAAAVDRGRGSGTGHRGDFAAGNSSSTSRSPSPRQQGQQQEGWRGHRHHLLPRETDLP